MNKDKVAALANADEKLSWSYAHLLYAIKELDDDEDTLPYLKVRDAIRNAMYKLDSIMKQL